MQTIIFDIEHNVLIKNKAIKKILDSLDLCSMDSKHKSILRSTILDEINFLYRNLIGGKNGSYKI